MKISFSSSFSQEPQRFIDDLRRRIDNAGRHMGRAVAGRIAGEVTKRIQGSGWLQIYRDAITYRETPDGTEWAVAGLSKEENLFKFPADSSLASFEPVGDGRWPAEYNPWPIDMIPAANYRGTTIVVRGASKSSVESYRAARANNLPTLLAVLAEQNISVDPEGFPTADGGAYADIAYLAQRLELGYPGFPRKPHWGPAASVAESSGDRWLTSPDLVRLVDLALAGASPGEVAQMTKAEAAELDRLREATWS
jgi:hypothetical protein